MTQITSLSRLSEHQSVWVVNSSSVINTILSLVPTKVDELLIRTYTSLKELEWLRVIDFEWLPDWIQFIDWKFKIINEIRVIEWNQIGAYEDHPRLKTTKVKFFVLNWFDWDEWEMTINYLDYRKFNWKYI